MTTKDFHHTSIYISSIKTKPTFPVKQRLIPTIFSKSLKFLVFRYKM